MLRHFHFLMPHPPSNHQSSTAKQALAHRRPCPQQPLVSALLTQPANTDGQHGFRQVLADPGTENEFHRNSAAVFAPPPLGRKLLGIQMSFRASVEFLAFSLQAVPDLPQPKRRPESARAVWSHHGTFSDAVTGRLMCSVCGRSDHPDRN